MKGVHIIFLSLFFIVQTFAQSKSSNIEIISDSFEFGYGNWNDGGLDCRISTNHSVSGVYSVQLKDNSNCSSSLYSDPLKLAHIDKVTFSFNFFTYSMEEKENFYLEISTDGGSHFEVYENWVSGKDFENNISNAESLIISYDFTDNTVFRLRCDGSSNNDQIYIDLIEIVEGVKKDKSKIVVVNDTKMINIETISDKSSADAIKLYPNPASESVSIDLKTGLGLRGSIEIYNLVGSKLSRAIFKEDHPAVIKLPTDFLENGYYSVCVRTNDDKLHVMRMLVSH